MPGHEPGGAQHGKMLRDGRLVGTDHVRELAHAALLRSEHVEQEEAGGMPEGTGDTGTSFVAREVEGHGNMAIWP